MPDLRDFELLKTDQTDRSPDGDAPPRTGIWIAAAVVLALAIVAVYVFYGRRLTPPPKTATAPAVQAPAAVQPLGGDADRIALPPLAETDPIVRELVRKITIHPSALAWLTTNGLIRNFTVVVANVVEGLSPARHLRVLQLTRPFAVVERNGTIFADPRSYDRYDAVAAAATSIDPAGAAKLYATLKPRIEEAYGELGSPDSFDRTLERAIVVLLQAPAVDAPLLVAQKGIGYRFADPRLEDLTAAQKQLMRAGPRNVRTIQSALRQLAQALGIPPERLPKP